MCARIARNELLYNGCYVHVISRSIRKLTIFKGMEDFYYFKECLISEKRKSRFKIFHYCLMHTHFHLVLEVDDVKKFSQGMSNIKRAYAGYFHDKYKLSGPIWRERFKSLLIENEGYMFACGSYVEENPVKAGLVKSREDWEFSSSRYYLKNKPDELIDKYDDIEKIKNIRIDKEGGCEEFERGSLIGSSFFRFKFFDSRKR